eukprot:g30730.t1
MRLELDMHQTKHQSVTTACRLAEEPEWIIKQTWEFEQQILAQVDELNDRGNVAFKREHLRPLKKSIAKGWSLSARGFLTCETRPN